MRIIVFISLLLFLPGCFIPTFYNVNELSERGRYITNVPFFPQAVNYCGAAWSKESINKLKKEIDNGHPLILYIDLGYPTLPLGHPFFPSGHYIVVVGYDDDRKGVIVYSGEDKNLFIPYNKLHKVWGKTGFWTLLILPKDFKGEQ
ncbi:MAG: PA2778 family cysteine peptidase [Deltaproteobacteria bacterium]|nr:PA2778 family cysteine peptidase [Deltaproteobacteria bacterium]